MDTSDESLVERCQQELPYHTEAFTSLMRRYEPIVYRTCLRYLGNPSDAEDAAQDAFVRMFHGLPRFSGKSLFRTWLYRIVANVCATRYRKMRKESDRKATYLEYAREQRLQQTMDTAASIEMGGPVAEALDQLSVEDRQVIVLRHVSELTIPEVAEVIGLKLSAAKMRVSRAESRLRDIYHRLVGKVGKSGDFLSGL